MWSISLTNRDAIFERLLHSLPVVQRPVGPMQAASERGHVHGHHKQSDSEYEGYHHLSPGGRSAGTR
ncbi:hypothetical protein HLASF_0287 [Halanaeroarchaeum sulfurireducens]|uniref:Uncharacterized protein n=1 Tax=Halanaeroarchaeum sulfurireducens TaxID=1604004 RepID=A0A0F7PAX6_9EURY|nr:hypothetical protein HLASF_0287 [Halanaeroarchaeum sulfurireducens]ALG81196.1 hypothetical protein HLASA_0286 [Halanaeroarchaeum sulfurireducens]